MENIRQSLKFLFHPSKRKSDLKQGKSKARDYLDSITLVQRGNGTDRTAVAGVEYPLGSNTGGYFYPRVRLPPGEYYYITGLRIPPRYFYPRVRLPPRKSGGYSYTTGVRLPPGTSTLPGTITLHTQGGTSTLPGTITLHTQGDTSTLPGYDYPVLLPCQGTITPIHRGVLLPYQGTITPR